MPRLTIQPSQADLPVGVNQSQTQQYVPVERTIGYGQLPPAITTSNLDLLAIQQDGVTRQITLNELATYFNTAPVTSVNSLTGAVQIGVYNLTDTTILNPLDNDFLVYENSRWINKSVANNVVISWNGLKGVVSAGLGSLTDVTLSSLSNGQVLMYSTSKLLWENKNLSDLYPDLTDANGLVTITGSAGLRVNNATNTYGAVTFHDNRPAVTNVLPTTNQSAVALIGDLQALNLNNLHDVSMSNPVPNSNIVSWNEVASKWVNVAYDPTGNVQSMLWTPTSVTTGEFSSVCFDSNGLTVILASSSGDGLYWTENGKAVYQSNIATGSFYKVILFQGYLYAAGTVGVLKSEDGKTWAATVITASATNLLADDNILLAFFAAPIGVRQTVNGYAWTAPIATGIYKVGDVDPDPISTHNIWLIGGNGVVSYSLNDGATWTTQAIAENATAITYAFGNSFLVATTVGLFAASVIFGTSGPTTTWELLVAGSFTDVIFNSGLILATQLNDVPLWSTDGYTWFSTTGSLPEKPLHTAQFGNGYWTAGGTNTGIWWSIDGKEWALSNQTTGTLNKAIYGGTVWLALMGNNAGILWSNNTAGKVISVNGQSGIVEIGLNNLRGTKILNPIDGDFLIYKNGLWENRNLIDLQNITVHNLTVTEAANIHELAANQATVLGLATLSGGLNTSTANLTGLLAGINANLTGTTALGVLNVTGATTLTGTLNANGAIIAAKTLTVTQGATFNAGLTSTFGNFTGRVSVSGQDLGIQSSNSAGNGFKLYNTTSTVATTGTLQYMAQELVFNGVADTISYKGSELANLANLSAYTTTAQLTTLLAAKAPLNSPALTGTPTAPTAALNTATTQLATTAFVANALAGIGVYPNLVSSGTGIDTLLTYSGTQGMTLSRGPLVVNAEAQSTFLYRPKVTTPAQYGLTATSFALVSDILSGTALDAKFKTVTSLGAISGASLSATGAISGASLGVTGAISGASLGVTGAITATTGIGITTSGAVSVAGTGNPNGYGLIATTPNGVYAVNGTSQLGALTMLQSSTANRGISYPNMPYGSTYQISFSYDGSGRLVFMPDNNAQFAKTLANLADVTNNGVGITAAGGNVNGSWILYANNILQQWGQVSVNGGGGSVVVGLPLYPGELGGGVFSAPNQTVNTGSAQAYSTIVPGPNNVNFTIYNNSSVTQVLQWVFIGRRG